MDILKHQNPSGSIAAPNDTTNVDYIKFKETLPDNLRLTPEKDYHMYEYWRLNGQPENFDQGKNTIFWWDRSDKGWHAGSIAEDPETGIYHFMKPKHHSTVGYELDWFNKGLRTLEGGRQVPVRGKHKKFWEDFTSKYQLDTTGVDYKYVPVQKTGGVIKAQEGTNLFTPSPLSPADIALNQARLLSKGEQKTSVSGNEIIGPDGNKVFIRTEQPLQPLEQNIAEVLPGPGDVAEIGYLANDIKNRNYGMALLGAGLLSVPGNAGAIVRKGRKLPAADTIRDQSLRETVEFLNNFGVEKIPFETYLELDDAIRFADIGVKGNKARIKNATEHVMRDINDYINNAASPMKKSSKVKTADNWRQPFDEMTPIEDLGHRGKTTEDFILSDNYKKGGSIHIKKKNRGKFTDYCGGKVTQECITRGKKSSDPKIRKRATFAANARRWKHENGGILSFQNSGILPEIEASIVTAPSVETKTFFDDFGDRYKNYHNRDIKNTIRKRIYNDSPLTNVGDHDYAGAYYTPKNDKVSLFTNTTRDDDEFSAVYTHELTHKLNDRLFNGLKRTRGEKKLLREAYGKPDNSMLPFISRAKNKLNPHSEAFTTNTELRRKISLKSGNLTGKALDDYIMSMSDEELGNMFNVQGYYPRSAYNKRFEGKTGQELFYNVNKIDSENPPQGWHWNDLPKNNQRYYNRLARKGNDVFTDSQAWDSERLSKVRNALITVA